MIMNQREFLLKKLSKQQISNIICVGLALTLILYFLFHPELYTTGSIALGNLSIGKKKLLLEFSFLAASLLLIFATPPIFKKHPKLDRILATLMTVATPFITFFITQVVVNSMPKNFSKTHNVILTTKSILLNVLILAVILIVLMAITNSLKTASILCLWFGLIFSLLNYFIHIFRGGPILASDLASAKTAFDVASNYTFLMNTTCILALEAGFLFILFFRNLHCTKIFQSKKRWFFIGFTVIVLGCFAKFFVLSDYLMESKINLYMFKPLVTYNRHGSFLTFVRSFQYLRVTPPDNYTADEIEQIAQEYQSDASKIQGNAPNIIVIVDEAFSDIGFIGDFGASEDYMPFFRSLKENTIRGYSYASILGGNTANTEFEFLTGNSITAIPTNSIAFQLYVNQPMPSLASNCALLGYESRYSMHPYRPGNYSRNRVYNRFGFKEFLSEDDFPEGTPVIRNFISNKAVNDMITSKYEEARNNSASPFLFYTMTMQDHGSYTNQFDNLPETISLAPEHDNASAKQYINLIKKSDEALQELVEYYQKVDEPTIIVFFGDHQPRLESSFLKSITDGAYSNWSEEDSMKQYAIPFIIWGNYDLPKQQDVRTSMNYLQSIMAKQSGLPLTGYQKYLLKLQTEIPVYTEKGYWGADGKFYDLEDTSSSYYDKIEEYQRVLYNNLFDTKNRPKNFYDLTP